VLVPRSRLRTYLFLPSVWKAIASPLAVAKDMSTHARASGWAIARDTNDHTFLTMSNNYEENASLRPGERQIGNHACGAHS
jgi:hypothetical protein